MTAESTRLVLLRHGRTSWNAEGRAQGHTDVELDDVGHAQAAAVAPLVARLGPAVLWSSDLARTRQTAAYVEKETGLVARLDPRLREYDVGERTGMTIAEFAGRLPSAHAAWQAGRYDAVPGAEGTDDVRVRIVAACRELLASVAPGATAVAVTHGAALRVAVVSLLGWPEEHKRSLHVLDNGAMAVLDVPVEGVARLVSWNTGPAPAVP